MPRFAEISTIAISGVHRQGHAKPNRGDGQNPWVMSSWMNAGHDWLDGAGMGPMAAEITEKKRERRRIERELFDDENAPPY
jgi:hypothetical protein